MAMLIATETALDVLTVKLESPTYSAVSESVPTGSVVVVRIAVSPLRLAVPREVDPSKNCTDPVGARSPGATTPIVAALAATGWAREAGRRRGCQAGGGTRLIDCHVRR